VRTPSSRCPYLNGYPALYSGPHDSVVEGRGERFPCRLAQSESRERRAASYELEDDGLFVRLRPKARSSRLVAHTKGRERGSVSSYERRSEAASDR